MFKNLAVVVVLIFGTCVSHASTRVDKRIYEFDLVPGKRIPKSYSYSSDERDKDKREFSDKYGEMLAVYRKARFDAGASWKDDCHIGVRKLLSEAGEVNSYSYNIRQNPGPIAKQGHEDAMSTMNSYIEQLHKLSC